MNILEVITEVSKVEQITELFSTYWPLIVPILTGATILLGLLVKVIQLFRSMRKDNVSKEQELKSIIKRLEVDKVELNKQLTNFEKVLKDILGGYEQSTKATKYFMNAVNIRAEDKKYLNYIFGNEIAVELPKLDEVIDLVEESEKLTEEVKTKLDKNNEALENLRKRRRKE